MVRAVTALEQMWVLGLVIVRALSSQLPHDVSVHVAP
jgi:hypothetical protein